MNKKFPLRPANPERLCWGCDDYCAAASMKCGNGSDRTQHPFELFGEDWHKWGCDYSESPIKQVASPLKNPEPAPRPPFLGDDLP